MTIRVLSNLTLLTFLFNMALGQASMTSGTHAQPSFEIADVHSSPASAFPPFQHDGFLIGDRYELRQATMAGMIAAAYELKADDVRGGPSWLDWDRFDIIAEAPPGTTSANLQLMLQSLLEQRFGLVAHKGTAIMPAYVLAIGKGKANLKPSSDTDSAGCEVESPSATAASSAVPQPLVSCHGMTMEAFAQKLRQMAGGYLDKPVVDQTGLKGPYDFTLHWTPLNMLANAGASGISIFDAVQRELGLNLKLGTAPQSALIVDSVHETPTSNPPGLAKSLPPLPPAKFDVATIKPAKPGIVGSLALIDPDRLRFVNASLSTLIEFAWNVPREDSGVVVGGAPWLDNDRFDVEARILIDPSLENAPPSAPRVYLDQLRSMERQLLEDRFDLLVHWEDRTMSAYSLVAVKPRLTRANPNSRTRCIDGAAPGEKDPRVANPALDRSISCQNVTMAQFGEELQQISHGTIHYPVSDATGLKGGWNLTLSFTSTAQATALASAPPQADSLSSGSEPTSAVSLFDAVARELGLRLVKEKRPEPVLVIDHVNEQPSAN
jgi:uncharacterized protein (TIGR03435 family)